MSEGSGGDHPRSRLRRLAWAAAGTAAVLVVAAIALASIDSTIARVLALLCVVGAAAAALITLLVPLYERVLHRWWTEELRTAQGLALLDSLPPGLIMERLLTRLYGRREANDFVARGILGGAGLQSDTGDLSISASTSVRYELRSEIPGFYLLTSTVEHAFDTPVTDHTLVLFATCDPTLRDLIVVGCERPLFDWVFIPRNDQFLSDEAVIRSVELGLRYLDVGNVEREIEVRTVPTTIVNTDDWPRYLSFFRRAVGSIPYRDPKRHLNVLEIVEVDLSRLVERPEQAIRGVTGLTLRSVTSQPDDGVCFWQAPFPCHLDEVRFDIEGLADEHDRRLEFTVQPFLPKTEFVVSPDWVPGDRLGALPVRSWAHPGHGIALLWRPAQDQDGRS